MGKALFYAVCGGLYGLAAWYTAGIVVTTERGEPSQTPILALPPPSTLLIGITVVGFAVFLAYRGLTRDFEDVLPTDEMETRGRRYAVAVGLVGYVSRALAIGIASGIMVSARIGLDPVEDIGLDRALGELSSAVAGPFLLGALGLGLIAFGLYSFGPLYPLSWRPYTPTGTCGATTVSAARVGEGGAHGQASDA